MITKLYIKNFQAHADSYLEFAPGVNVIVGENDQGKTSIVRFIRWMAFNRPLGDSIIRDGTDAVEGTLCVMNDGVEFPINRLRTKSKNIYQITEGDTDEKVTFEAFGSDPPEHIRNVLQLDDLNVQDQFDPYFLITRSPGQIAQTIRYHTDMEVIDLAVSASTTKIKHAKDELGHAREQQSEIQAVLDDLAKYDLDQFEDLLRTLVHLNDVEDENKEALEKLSKTIADYEACEVDLRRYPDDLSQAIQDGREFCSIAVEVQQVHDDIQSKIQIVDDLERKIIDLHPVENLIGQARDLSVQLGSVAADLIQLSQLTDQLVKIESQLAFIVPVDEVRGLGQRFTVVLNTGVANSRVLSTLPALCDRFQAASGSLTVLGSSIKKAEEELQEAASKLDICIVCQQKLEDPTAVQHVLEHIREI